MSERFSPPVSRSVPSCTFLAELCLMSVSLVPARMMLRASMVMAWGRGGGGLRQRNDGAAAAAAVSRRLSVRLPVVHSCALVTADPISSSRSLLCLLCPSSIVLDRRCERLNDSFTAVSSLSLPCYPFPAGPVCTADRPRPRHRHDHGHVTPPRRDARVKRQTSGSTSQHGQLRVSADRRASRRSCGGGFALISRRRKPYTGMQSAQVRRGQ